MILSLILVKHWLIVTIESDIISLVVQFINLSVKSELMVFTIIKLNISTVMEHYKVIKKIVKDLL